MAGVVSLIAVVVMIFGFTGFSRELIRRYQINKDIQEVREEIAGLEKQNEELSYLVDYLNTDSFKEIQARQNLGLQQPGETAVVVDTNDLAASSGHTVTFRQGEDAMSDSSTDVDTEMAPDLDSQSTIKAWWAYFFAPHEE